MHKLNKKIKLKKIKYFEIYHFFTTKSGKLEIQGAFDGEKLEQIYLVCPKKLVNALLKIVDEVSGNQKLSNAIRKKIATGKPSITISVSKVLGFYGGIAIDSTVIMGTRMVDEDKEYDEGEIEAYWIESFTKL